MEAAMQAQKKLNARLEEERKEKEQKQQEKEQT